MSKKFQGAKLPDPQENREEGEREREGRGGEGRGGEELVPTNFQTKVMPLQASICQIIGQQLEVPQYYTISIKCRLQSSDSDVTSAGNSK
jgi:hypothetical protein